jgi:hypothetical protein
MNHLIFCPCGEVIVKSLDNDAKVRAKIIVFRDDTAFAVCKSCNKEVKIPLRLDTDLLKSLSSKRVPLYVNSTLMILQKGRLMAKAIPLFFRF